MPSSAYTVDEVRAKLLRHVKGMLRYWLDESGTTEDRMEGLVFSTLATLDGEAGDMPPFLVIAKSCEDDKAYHVERGENYYPDPVVGMSVSGSLHEEWSRLCDK